MGGTHARWVEGGRRVASSTALFWWLSGLVAVLEATVRADVPTGVRIPGLVAVAVLALGTTVPPAVLPIAPATSVMVIAAGLSSGFGSLTVVGGGATLLALFRLGRQSPPQAPARFVAPVLALPFLGLALHDDQVLLVLMAGLAPAAAWAGLAEQARAQAQVHHAAREAVATSLVAHTARGERVRIARELHDVVAHHISMVAVQAETARLTTPGLPVAGAQRFREIGDTARAGLREMRRLLGVLREEEADGIAVRHPQPGLEGLNDLLDSARGASGAATRLIMIGAPVALGPGAELAAYRIVQEALTNARRHAPGAAVDVELRYGESSLCLQIRDNGPGPGAIPGSPGSSVEEGGHGLPGMRERVGAVGGSLRVDRAAGGGFLVEAVIPALAR